MSQQETPSPIRVANSAAADTQTAVCEVLDELDAADAQLTVLFYGVDHDDQIVARELDRVAGARGVAGTTAGEIGPGGFLDGTISGLSVHHPDARAAVEIIPQLDQLSLIPIVHLPEQLAERIGRSKEELDPKRHLWLFLVDGLSGKESLLTPFFRQAAPRVGLVGGSLGDGESFDNVRLIHHGRVYRNAAATILLEYPRPFVRIQTTHLRLTDRTLKVSRVTSGGRRLEQLDGELAVIGYARALGIDPTEVTRSLIASYPLGYRFRGRPFPCSILRVNDDGTMRLASSVQSGETLNILEPGDLVASTRETLRGAVTRLADQDGSPQGLLLFNCWERFVEARELGVLAELAEAMDQAPMCGLNTYGEQFDTNHVNHSLAGVLFG